MFYLKKNTNSDKACLDYFRLHWLSALLNFYRLYCLSRRRQWHPTPVLLPENAMDRGAWKAVVHGVAEGRTRLTGFTFTFHFHALEKGMPTHSRALAWRIPGTGEPGGLPSMGSHRVRHDWSDLAAAAAARELVSSEIGYLAEAISKQSVPSKNWLLLNTYSKMWE